MALGPREFAQHSHIFDVPGGASRLFKDSCALMVESGRVDKIIEWFFFEDHINHFGYGIEPARLSIAIKEINSKGRIQHPAYMAIRKSLLGLETCFAFYLHARSWPSEAQAGKETDFSIRMTDPDWNRAAQNATATPVVPHRL